MTTNTRCHRRRRHPRRHTSRRSTRRWHRQTTRRPGVPCHRRGVSAVAVLACCLRPDHSCRHRRRWPYGAGLFRYLDAQHTTVIEVDRPNRRARRLQGKSDPLDAIAAARAVLAETATTPPKPRTGAAEAIRILHTTRASAVKSRTIALNQLNSLIISGPDDLRAVLNDLSRRRGDHPPRTTAHRPHRLGRAPDGMTHRTCALSPTECELQHRDPHCRHPARRAYQDHRPGHQRDPRSRERSHRATASTVGDNPCSAEDRG